MRWLQVVAAVGTVAVSGFCCIEQPEVEAPDHYAPHFLVDSTQVPQLAVVGQPVCDTLSAIDPDGSPLHFRFLDSIPSAALTGDVLTFTPAGTDTGFRRFTVVVYDPAGKSDTLTWVTRIMLTDTLVGGFSPMAVGDAWVYHVMVYQNMGGGTVDTLDTITVVDSVWDRAFTAWVYRSSYWTPWLTDTIYEYPGVFADSLLSDTTAVACSTAARNAGQRTVPWFRYDSLPEHQLRRSSFMGGSTYILEQASNLSGYRSAGYDSSTYVPGHGRVYRSYYYSLLLGYTSTRATLVSHNGVAVTADFPLP